MQTVVYLPHFISWVIIGGLMTSLLSPSTGISPELYEAVTVDRVGRLQKIRHITLPAIAGTVAVMLILRTGSLMMAGFDQMYVLQTPAVMDVGDALDTFVYRYGLALVLPFFVTPYNAIIMKNFFESLPEELEEAAFIDGARTHRPRWNRWWRDYHHYRAPHHLRVPIPAKVFRQRRYDWFGQRLTHLVFNRRHLLQEVIDMQKNRRLLTLAVAALSACSGGSGASGDSGGTASGAAQEEKYAQTTKCPVPIFRPAAVGHRKLLRAATGGGTSTLRQLGRACRPRNAL